MVQEHFAGRKLPLGYPKQSKLTEFSFVLDVPVRNLLSSKVLFVPCDRKLQRAYSNQFPVFAEEFRDFAMSHPEYSMLFTQYQDDQTDLANVKSNPDQEHVQLAADA